VEDETEKKRKEMAAAFMRAFESMPIPHKPYCLKCGPVDERIGIMGIGEEFLCPKCGQVLNSRRI
jgi:hypothetical protein